MTSTMEDPNLIAWLLPAIDEDKDKNSRSWEAIRMNISKCIPPQEGTDLRSRESTVSSEDEEDNTPNPGLQLTFNPGPKADQGLVLGCDPNCDIVLPRLSKISRRHCALAFDAQRRLILRDFSLNGTIVKYDGEGGEIRHHFTWILGGHDVPRKTNKILIEIHGISFRITVSTHDTCLDLYNANVDQFLQQINTNNELPFGILGIHSTSSTVAPSGSQTPIQGPIRIKQETLGTGEFAIVRRFWDVSTGFDYAYKEPHKKKRFDQKAWEKEADIMGQISHDHVVALVAATFTPRPRLVLEYVPFGSLEDVPDLSVEEGITILCQGLSALEYLHEREEPIVHRDIKPGNILLQSTDPLHIKFTDFGLSKASNDLTTMCGTPLYLAPEVFKKESYKPVVDIWSLGVVIFKLVYGLPDHQGYRGRRWCEKIIEEANTLNSEDLIDFLLTTMLVIGPTFRYSAKPCLDRARELSILSRDCSLTPTPASYTEGYEALVFPDVHLTDDPNWRSSQHKDSISQSMARRYIRSDAPPPDWYEENEPVLDLFGEGWLRDPNCVGSSVAAIGEEDLSDWSSWSGQPAEPSKSHVQGRDASTRGCDNHGRNGACIDGEGYMAARLLYELHTKEGF